MTSPMSSTMTSPKTWRSMCTGTSRSFLLCANCKYLSHFVLEIDELNWMSARRISRTGRAGKRGKTISLWERRDWRKARELVRDSAFSSLCQRRFFVQVTIMEEARHEVPSWLTAEADRFTKHEVQGSFVWGGFCIKRYAYHLPHRLQRTYCKSRFVAICRLPPRLDRERKAKEEEMQEEVERQVTVDASSVGRRLAL